MIGAEGTETPTGVAGMGDPTGANAPRSSKSGSGLPRSDRHKTNRARDVSLWSDLAYDPELLATGARQKSGSGLPRGDRHKTNRARDVSLWSDLAYDPELLAAAARQAPNWPREPHVPAAENNNT